MAEALRGGKIVTIDSISAIRSGDETVLRKLHAHSKDIVQRLLIELYFSKKGWTLEVEPESPMVA